MKPLLKCIDSAAMISATMATITKSQAADIYGIPFTSQLAYFSHPSPAREK